MNKKNREKDLITSKSFRDIADLIYSETITMSEFEQLDKNNLIVVSTTNTSDHKSVTYKRRQFEIHENDIIFSNTELIDDLFFHLKKVSNVNNITLITSESDDPISKNLYLKKPDSIKKWFSTNIAYNDENLFPIPLGLANSYSKKNINKEDLKNSIAFDFSEDKSLKMLINFRVNTNFSERRKIYEKYKGIDWVDIDNPDNNIDEYIAKIKKNDLVLCPWGNGIDTHRIFETLYLGSIPVTKYHPTYEYLKELPVIFIDNMLKINFEELNIKYEDIRKSHLNLEKLNPEWWRNLINNNEERVYIVTLEENQAETSMLHKKYTNKLKKRSRVKKLKYFLRRFRKFFKL